VQSKQALGHAKWTSIGQVMVKRNPEKILLNVAYNAHIFPTNTTGKKPRVKCMENLV
jgi:hypothetical protein